MAHIGLGHESDYCTRWILGTGRGASDLTRRLRDRDGIWAIHQLRSSGSP